MNKITVPVDEGVGQEIDLDRFVTECELLLKHFDIGSDEPTQKLIDIINEMKAENAYNEVDGDPFSLKNMARVVEPFNKLIMGGF